MMDLHIVIVISCVFLGSLFSLLFINKFFRRKTFEEVMAEKKALNDKIYQSKATLATAKKPKKTQQLKKELKREKKQRQKDQHRDTTEQEDSDAHSEPASVEEEPQGLSKTHVEFEPDPEVVTYNSETTPTAAISNAEKENVGGGGVGNKQKSKKDKKTVKTAGILVNKNEPVAIKESPVVELNTFEFKAPKDVLEMKKKDDKENKKEEKAAQQHKKEKAVKKEKQHVVEKAAIATEQPVVEAVPVAKDLKQQDEKARQGSPKNQQNATNKTKQQNKKQHKETPASKELVSVLDKLHETDTISVNLLMNLFRHADLNRSEIQILIDYLLNKQQDMPSTHSEWSDDILQKLKRQLVEKERALAEEQEASIGIQAKLRELRAEVNTERAQINATSKMFTEKMQAKDQEITGLNQELKSLNDKLTLERQQFQAKLLREKQACTQDLVAQLQHMQNELAHKDKCITELTCLVNASRQAVDETQQKNDIIQNQTQTIRVLEEKLDEAEKAANERIFDLENAKTIETANAELKAELLQLQNANAEAAQTCKNLDAMRAELTVAHNAQMSEKQNELQLLQAQYNELTQKFNDFNDNANAQSQEQTNLHDTLDAMKQQLAENEQQLNEFHAKNADLLQQLASVQSNTQQQTAQQQELQKIIDSLTTDVASKHTQLQEAQQNVEQHNNREHELQQQLQEQREKNNQQQQLLANVTTANTDSVKDQQQIRDLFQRLYPDAVKTCASLALNASFDQWIEQVLATHVKQSIATAVACSNNKTNATNNNNSNSNHNSTHNNNNNSHDSENSNSNSNNDILNNSNNRISSNNNNNSENTNNSSSSSSSSSSNNSNSNDAASTATDTEKIRAENAQLRIKNDELTKLVNKTSNTLSDLEKRAREQDENWRSIVNSKEELIRTLQHSNGGQDI